MAMNRHIWRALGDVPAGTRVLGVNVLMPHAAIVLADSGKEGVVLGADRVFVEVGEEEWKAINGDVARANAKAKELGAWIAAQMGGYVRAWHD